MNVHNYQHLFKQMFIQMNVRLIFVLTMILIKIENKAIHEETMIWQCDVYCFQAVPNTHLMYLTRLCIQSGLPHFHETFVIWYELVYFFKEFNGKYSKVSLE